MEALQKRIKAFARLGEYLRKEISSDEEMKAAIEQSLVHNRWFVRENIDYSFRALGAMLNKDNLNAWLLPYQQVFNSTMQSKVVALVMAGNIPLVGFHDFLSVLISGHKVLAKLSSDDKFLLPVIAQRLIDFYPAFADAISITEDIIQKPEAVIATGSNNSARYFEYYFGKYPHIIRKNRNGIAVLSGKETTDDLMALGEDIFRYFGLGCRNVSKLYVPENYNFDALFEALESFKGLANHNKYKNNYEYYRSIYLINKVQHLDNGFVMICPEEAIASPLSVIYYENYSSVDEVNNMLSSRKDEIQCVVSSMGLQGAIPFGQSQLPQLADYADGVNTLDFLAELCTP